MKFDELINNWKTKNKDKIIRLEQLRDSAIEKDRVKKNFALWSKREGGKINEIDYRTFSVWVLNPGKETEESYFDGSEPLYTPTTSPVKSFRDLVVEYLNSQSILGSIIESIDESLNTAIAKVYIDKSTTKRWLLRKNKMGSIEHFEVL